MKKENEFRIKTIVLMIFSHCEGHNREVEQFFIYIAIELNGFKQMLLPHIDGC